MHITRSIKPLHSAVHPDKPSMLEVDSACNIASLTDRLNELSHTRDELHERSITKTKTFQTLSDDIQRPLLRLQSKLQELLARELNEQMFDDEAVALSQTVGEISLLLENLLQWSKYQSQPKRLVMQPCKWETIVHDAINQMKFAAAEKQITLDSNIEGSLDIMADAEMITSVVRTLLQNIICLLSPDSNIHLAVESNNELHVYFKGDLKSFNIPVEIFNIKNYDGAVSEIEKSVSLGWMYCRAVIDDHKGSIRVVSTQSGLEVVVGLKGA